MGVYLAIFINSDLQKTLIGKISKFRIDRENMVILTNESANSRLKFLLRSGIVILVSGSGLLYIISTEYFHLTLPFIFPAWGSQHSPAYFYTLNGIIAGMYFLPANSTNVGFKFLVTVGKASFHIFLIQMVYFWLYNHLPRLPLHLFFSSSLQVAVDIFICISVGLVFSEMDGWTKKINLLS